MTNVQQLYNKALIIKNLGNDVRGADVEHELFTQYQLIENGIIKTE